jgi:hypothetical protein
MYCLKWGWASPHYKTRISFWRGEAYSLALSVVEVALTVVEGLIFD